MAKRNRVEELHSETSLKRIVSVIRQKCTEKSSIICHFQEDFKAMEDTLNRLQPYLVHANSVISFGDSVEISQLKNFLEKANSIIDEAEDTVDRCSLSFMEIGNIGPHKFFYRHKLDSQIKSICESLQGLKKKAIAICLNEKTETLLTLGDTEGEEWIQEDKLDPEGTIAYEPNPVGMEERIQDLVDLLQKCGVPVVGVHGMGGLGKTLLVRHVIERIKGTYDSVFFVSVSQNSSNNNVAEYIYKSVWGDGLPLSGKKYLIVLDDIRETSEVKNLFKNSKHLLPLFTNCQILFTTRSSRVVEIAGALPYRMEKLGENDSLELFCRFSSFHDQSTPEGLMDVAEEITAKCNGLPLALKIIGSSLKGKPFQLWIRMDNFLTSLHTAVEEKALNILSLSYDYGERWLVNCWMSEGSLYRQDELYQVGLKNMQEKLSLAEINEKYTDVYKLLVIDRVVRRIEELLKRYVSGRWVFPQRHCRSSVASQSMALISNDSPCPPSVRTLVFAKNMDLHSIPDNFLLTFSHGRHLDLQHTLITAIPDCIKNMTLLRHLDLSHTLIKEVPECVRYLVSLVFLGIYSCPKLERLPVWIGELLCLQKLRFGWSNKSKAFPLPKSASSLVNMSQLEGDVKICSGSGLMTLQDFTNLTKLQQLSLYIEEVGALGAIQEGKILSDLPLLETLHLHNRVCGSSSAVPCCSTSTNQLFLEHAEIHETVFSAVGHNKKELILDGFKVPTGLHNFGNLVMLELIDFKCQEELMLETLPSLEHLKLQGNHELTQLPIAYGNAGSFPKLQILIIRSFSLLESLPKIHDGAMPSLNTLHVHDCNSMKELPEGFEILLKTLKYIETSGLGSPLMDRRMWLDIEAANPRVEVNIVDMVMIAQDHTSEMSIISPMEMEMEQEETYLIKCTPSELQVILRDLAKFDGKHHRPQIFKLPAANVIE